MIQDSFSRTIDYVRVAVTDRCNLRCFYCMPEEGIRYEPKESILSYEEIVRLLEVLGQMGFRKVRFTGGEPFVRKDFMDLLTRVSQMPEYEAIHITSNGVLLGRYIDALKQIKVRKINLSLDSLERSRFFQITRRDNLPQVMDTFHRLVAEGFDVKINAVVMAGINERDIIPLSQLAKDYPVTVRFIEEMPFNGGAGSKFRPQVFRYRDILATLKNEYPDLEELPMLPGDTTREFQIPGFLGKVGVIAAFSRTFCNTCNRLRITAKGEIKTCLYDDGVFNILDYVRSGVDDARLQAKFTELIRLKPKDGFEAEKQRKSTEVNESMSTIGG